MTDIRIVHAFVEGEERELIEELKARLAEAEEAYKQALDDKAVIRDECHERERVLRAACEYVASQDWLDTPLGVVEAVQRCAEALEGKCLSA